jgi:hypothetical protein
MIRFWNLLQETIRKVEPPLARFILIIFCIGIMALSGAVVFLSKKIDNSNSVHEADLKIEIAKRDSTIGRLINEKDYLSTKIFEMSDNFNKERIEFIESTLEKVNKIQRKMK